MANISSYVCDKNYRSYGFHKDLNMWCVKYVEEAWMMESVLNWGQHPSKDQFHHSQTSLSLSHYLLHHLAFLAGVPIQSGDMALDTTLGSFFWSIALCSPFPRKNKSLYISENRRMSLVLQWTNLAFDLTHYFLPGCLAEVVQIFSVPQFSHLWNGAGLPFLTGLLWILKVDLDYYHITQWVSAQIMTATGSVTLK